MIAGCFKPSDLRVNRLWRCYHSGDLGDIIYSLPFCKSLGIVQYLIGPNSGVRVRETMTRSKFEWLAPLLVRQPWIEDVEFAQNPPACDYDLNQFRKSWFSAANAFRKDKRLYECYFEHFVKPNDFDENKPWLSADPALDTAHPVVINRTNRWQHHNFPWREIAERYQGRMVFLGTPQEHKDWSRQFGAIEYREVVDALDLANIIAGCQLFVGNQSFAMSVALGLGVPVIQESCPIQADCVLKRSNAQFTHISPSVTLPKITPETMRPVSTQPNRNGVIELGPCNGAGGVGDTLMLTPLARALGKRAVMILPSSMERMKFLFRNLCPVQISDNHPVSMWQKDILQSIGFLRMFQLGGQDPIPRIDLDPDAIKAAREGLASIRSPLAFCPTCSRHWSHVRQRPPLFWRPIIAELSKRFTVLQFGLKDYPDVPGTRRMPFVSLEHLAATYHLIGNYVGVNTGDHHLMLSVGGRAIVAEADPFHEWRCWTYNSPQRIQYGKLSNPKTVLEAIQKLPL